MPRPAAAAGGHATSATTASVAGAERKTARRFASGGGVRSGQTARHAPVGPALWGPAFPPQRRQTEGFVFKGGSPGADRSLADRCGASPPCADSERLWASKCGREPCSGAPSRAHGSPQCRRRTRFGTGPTPATARGEHRSAWVAQRSAQHPTAWPRWLARGRRFPAGMIRFRLFGVEEGRARIATAPASGPLRH